MKIHRSDLVELFVQLGFPSAKNWDARKLKARVKRLGEISSSYTEDLTQDARNTLFVCQASLEAEQNDWGDPIALHPPKRAKKVSAYPLIEVSDRYARQLFAWMQKKGFRSINEKWEDLDDEQREELIAEAAERMVMFFCHDGEV